MLFKGLAETQEPKITQGISGEATLKLKPSSSKSSLFHRNLSHHVAVGIEGTVSLKALSMLFNALRKLFFFMSFN